MNSVLFVDDEAGFLDVMGRRLRRRGFEPTLATSGEEALMAVAGNSFDIVVTDLKMPGMNGLVLMARLRQCAPHIPVVLLTGHAGAEEAQEALRLGAVAYLHKPCDLETLLECFTKALQAGEKQTP